MGCNCGSGRRNTVARTRALRPTSGPRSIQGGSAAGASPATLRAIGLQSNVTLNQTRQMDAERRRIEKLRRDAIKRRLNK